jgi:hypothetical protein
MNKPMWLLTAAAAAFGSACTTSPENVDSIAADLISVVAADARSPGPNSAVPARPGPVLVDVKSFTDHRAAPHSALAGQSRTAALVPLGVSPVRGWRAVRCRFFADDCVGQRDELYIRLDSLTNGEAGTMDAFVTYRWSELLRSREPALGEAELHLEFRLGTRGWKISRKTVLGAT